MTADDVLRALAEPQRVRILRVVGHRELATGEIAEHRDGTRRLSSIRPEAIESVRDFLDELWPSALGRLTSTVEGDRREKRRTESA